MAALDPASAPAALSASRSSLRVLATAVAVAVAVALELTGPPRPFLFSLRLPLVVLAIGAAWTEASWRGDASSRRQPVPMATPCLMVTSTAAVAAVTVRLVTWSPVMACVALSVASAACCLAVGVLVTGAPVRRRAGSSPRPRRPPAGGCRPGAAGRWRTSCTRTGG